MQPIIIKKPPKNIKQQIFKTAALPAGVPEHIYHFLEQCGGQKCGIKVTEEQLLKVLEENDDYLKPSVRQECRRHVPDVNYKETQKMQRLLNSLYDLISIKMHFETAIWTETLLYIQKLCAKLPCIAGIEEGEGKKGIFSAFPPLWACYAD